MIKWLMVFTIFNGTSLGHYKSYPFETKEACEARVTQHTNSLIARGIPKAHMRGDCVIYSLTWH